MSWSGLANNQTISFSNLDNAVTTGVFILKAGIADSAEQITKADADAKVYIDTSYSPYSSKASNQLVVKSDLRAGFAVYGASYGCVVPDTEILINPDFSRKADTFDVGDIVFTQHEDTKMWGHFKVAAIERKEQPILHITTDKGDIRCSTTHLVYKGEECVKAEDLAIGDSIVHLKGDAVITDIVPEGTSTVIEFNIEDAHTYVAAGFMAHNKCTLNGWTTCSDACTNGVTAYGTVIYYTGPLQVGTVINTTSCSLSYTRFYYYAGGYLEITWNGTNYEVVSLDTCPCDYFVTIDVYVPSAMTCYMSYTYAANADFNVDTNVDVEIDWYGDLGGMVSGTATIASGTACDTVGVNSGGSINCLGENWSNDAVVINPSSYGNQIYQYGQIYVGTAYPC